MIAQANLRSRTNLELLTYHSTNPSDHAEVLEAYRIVPAGVFML